MRSGYLPVAEGVPRTMVSDDELLGEKRSPWVSLREALDQVSISLTFYKQLFMYKGVFAKLFSTYSLAL